jgi:hypothetical protein
MVFLLFFKFNFMLLPATRSPSNRRAGFKFPESGQPPSPSPSLRSRVTGTGRLRLRPAGGSAQAGTSHLSAGPLGGSRAASRAVTVTGMVWDYSEYENSPGQSSFGFRVPGRVLQSKFVWQTNDES